MIHKDTGRRLGRAIGSLDDMILALESMEHEADNPALKEMLDLLLYQLRLAHNEAQATVGWVNRELSGAGR